MQALTKFSVVITFAALSLCGSAAWAADSFVATAELNGFNVVPPILASAEGKITITFTKPTTTGATIALAQVLRNPWASGINKKTANDTTSFRNIRLYFGQRFANGLPILTLCDPCELKSPLELLDGGDFALSDIQFQGDQSKILVFDGIGHCGRLTDDEDGFNRIRNLIKAGLIYVVVGSALEASEPDPACQNIIYTPPDTPPAPPGTIFIDGDLRGTLVEPQRPAAPPRR